MRVEAGNVCRVQLRCRAASEESHENKDMMENVVTDPPASVSTVMMMSLIDLLMLNAIVCGLEFCASAAFCYIPPLLLKAGIRCEIFFVATLYTTSTEPVTHNFYHAMLYKGYYMSLQFSLSVTHAHSWNVCQNIFKCHSPCITVLQSHINFFFTKIPGVAFT